MADISAFPTIRDILWAGDNLQSFTATEAVTAGQVVGFAATGVSLAVVPMDATSGEHAIGVAIYGQSAAGLVSVGVIGTICKVANADDTTTIDAGDLLGQDNNTVKGTVSTLDETTDSTTVANSDQVGIALQDIAGSGNGFMLVTAGIIFTRPNAA